MSFLSKLLGRSSQARTPAPVAGKPKFPVRDVGCGEFRFHIVGESNYQESIGAAAVEAGLDKSGRRVISCFLMPEPDNPHDRDAVAVMAVGHGCVGYIPQYQAGRRYAEMWSAHTIRLHNNDRVLAGCSGLIVGGPPDKFYGVVLDLDPDYLDSIGRRRGKR